MSRLEKNLNWRIQDAIKHRDPIRVENSVGDGTPDINYAEGWIESKQIPMWPKRTDSTVRVPHYRPAQRAWHVKRSKAGGLVHVVIQIGDDVLVFDGLTAARVLGHTTRRQMEYYAKLILSPWDARRFSFFIDAESDEME